MSHQTDQHISTITRVVLYAFLLLTAIGCLIALSGCSEAPHPDRPDYQAPTTDTYPDTIRYLIGPAGFEVWEFRTADGTRCLLAHTTAQGYRYDAARALSCEWRPSPNY